MIEVPTYATAPESFHKSELSQAQPGRLSPLIIPFFLVVVSLHSR